MQGGRGTSVQLLLSLQPWFLGCGSGGCGRGFPFGRVVEEVQAAAAGGNDIGHKLGAFSADVSQRAAVSVEVRKLLLHGAAGQRAQRPEERRGRGGEGGGLIRGCTH